MLLFAILKCRRRKKNTRKKIGVTILLITISLCTASNAQHVFFLLHVACIVICFMEFPCSNSSRTAVQLDWVVSVSGPSPQVYLLMLVYRYHRPLLLLLLCMFNRQMCRNFNLESISISSIVSTSKNCHRTKKQHFKRGSYGITSMKAVWKLFSNEKGRKSATLRRNMCVPLCCISIDFHVCFFFSFH